MVCRWFLVLSLRFLKTKGYFPSHCVFHTPLLPAGTNGANGFQQVCSVFHIWAQKTARRKMTAYGWFFMFKDRLFTIKTKLRALKLSPIPAARVQWGSELLWWRLTLLFISIEPVMCVLRFCGIDSLWRKGMMEHLGEGRKDRKQSQLVNSHFCQDPNISFCGYTHHSLHASTYTYMKLDILVLWTWIYPTLF